MTARAGVAPAGSTRRRLARLVVLTHRWLGIVLGALVVAWFLSGFVMLWRGMPELPTAERLAGLPPLSLDRATLSPAEALRTAGLGRAAGEARSLSVGLLGDRPVYRVLSPRGPITVFADTGSIFQGMSRDSALGIAVQRLEPPKLRWRHRRLVEPDQWTLQSRSLLPMHRFAFDDEDRTTVYVSERTGRVELVTDRDSRRWGWLGPVVHWVYFTPLRRHSTFWLQALVYSSAAAVLLTATGLGWGVWVWLRRRTFPYRGWLRWHHLAGMAFGLATFAWVLSGLLSLDPWDWHPGTSPTREQRLAMETGGSDRRDLELEELRAALSSLSRQEAPRELEIGWFRGRAFALSRSVATPGRRRLVWLDQPADLPAPLPERSALLEAAQAALPGHQVEDAELLPRGDAYYYPRTYGDPLERPLPVLRVRYDDPARTALYVDPLTGAPLHREQRLTRVNRWLYHGLHSWDHPALLRHPFARKAAMVLFLAGGLAASASAFVPGCRRLRAVVARRR